MVRGNTLIALEIEIIGVIGAVVAGRTENVEGLCAITCSFC